MKIPPVVAAIVTLVFVASGCASSSDGDSGSSSGKTITIGLVTQAWNNPAIKDMADAAIGQAKKEGNVKLLAQDSTDMQDMVTKLQTMISRDVDALGIEPWDKKQIVPILKQAKTAGIPVFILQSEVEGAYDDGLVVSSLIGDEVAGGRVAGKWLGAELGDGGKVVVLEGAPADTPGIERANGFEEGLKEASPSSTVVARQPADWARDKALRVTTDILTANSDVDAIFADNDEMAFGALSALEDAGREGVTVIGYNGTCIGLEATYKGRFAADGVLFLDKIGADFITSAKAHLDGEKIAEKILPPITLLSTAHLKEIEDGSTSVEINGKPFEVDDLLKARVDRAVTGKC